MWKLSLSSVTTTALSVKANRVIDELVAMTYFFNCKDSLEEHRPYLK